MKIYIYSFILLLTGSCQNRVGDSNSELVKNNNNIQKVGIVHPSSRTFTSEVSITGTAMPYQITEVHAMESGYVQSITKDIGDYILKDGTIATLINPEISNGVNETEANLRKAISGVLRAQAELRGWKAQSLSKKAILDRIENTYKRASNIVLASDVDNARADYEAVYSNMQSAEAGVEEARSIKSAASAMNETMKARVGMLRVKAPFSGILTKRYVDNGAVVRSGLASSDALPVVTIQDISKIRLTVQLPESDVSNVFVGNVVNITFPEISDEKIIAKISRMSNALDVQSKTMQVEIDLDNSNGKIKPGMYAKVSLNAISRKGKLTVPISAKKLIDDIPHLLIIEDGMVKKIRLNQGLEGRDYFEIQNSDVTDKTQVIVQGKNLVKEGQRVEGKIIDK